MSANRSALWVFADQALVSGCNFAVSALMARYLGVADFGEWILIFGLVLYANTVAGALLWLPMLTLTPRLTSELEQQRFLRGAFACQWVLALGASALLSGCATLAAWLKPEWLSVDAALLVGCVTLAFQLQDWLRRYCFAVGEPRPVFWLDLLAYGGQVGAVIALHVLGLLRLETALAGVMSAYLLAFVAGYHALNVRPDWAGARYSARELWQAGRAYLVGEQLQWVGTAGVLYVSAHLMGPQASGAVRAVQTLLGPTNMLFQAFNNLLMPRSGAVFRDGGDAKLKRYLLRVLVGYGLPLGAGLLVLSICGSAAMTLAFGASFAKYGALVGLQCVQVALTFLWLLALFRVRTLGRTDLIVRAGVAQAVVSLGVVLVATSHLAESGVVLASGFGVLAGLWVLLKC